MPDRALPSSPPPTVPDPAATVPGVWWDDVHKGDVLPPIQLHITHARAIQNVGAGRDFMRGHMEAGYAQRQGIADVFVNTTFHQAFVDRVVTDWAGPLSFIVRRRMQMADAIVAGDTIVGEGRVMQVREDERGRALADVLVNVSNGRARCTQAKVTVQLRRRGQAWPYSPASGC